MGLMFADRCRGWPAGFYARAMNLGLWRGGRALFFRIVLNYYRICLSSSRDCRQCENRQKEGGCEQLGDDEKDYAQYCRYDHLYIGIPLSCENQDSSRNNNA